MDGLKSRLADCAVAARAYPGETVSGDAWWVEQTPVAVLAALADGLGHGPEAAAAATRALALVRAAAGADVVSALRACHAGLQDTRGAALSLVHLDAATDTLTWLGVGNVNCILARAEGGRAVPVHALIPARGVLGRRLPALTARRLPIARGDVVILATDGIDAHHQHELPELEPLEHAAAEILRRHGAGGDDALVLVLRYRGASS